MIDPNDPEEPGPWFDDVFVPRAVPSAGLGSLLTVGIVGRIPLLIAS